MFLGSDSNGRRVRALRTVAAASFALMIAACGAGQSDTETQSDGVAAEEERQEFDFTGTVQTVDSVTNIVAVANDEVPGWMMAMTMNFYVHPPEVIESLEPGDRITATVYSGDFQNLYEVELVGSPQ